MLLLPRSLPQCCCSVGQRRVGTGLPGRLVHHRSCPRSSIRIPRVLLVLLVLLLRVAGVGLAVGVNPGGASGAGCMVLQRYTMQGVRWRLLGHRHSCMVPDGGWYVVRHALLMTVLYRYG